MANTPRVILRQYSYCFEFRPGVSLPAVAHTLPMASVAKAGKRLRAPCNRRTEDLARALLVADRVFKKGRTQETIFNHPKKGFLLPRLVTDKHTRPTKGPPLRRSSVMVRLHRPGITVLLTHEAVCGESVCSIESRNESTQKSSE